MGVADTHAAVWYLFGDPKLSTPARTFLELAAATRHKIAVSSMSLIELVYLVEKNRLPSSAYTSLKQALVNPAHVLEEVVIDSAIVEAMREVARTEIPDMPDRVIAATGLHLRVPVISRDGRIRLSVVPTIW